MKHLLFTTIAVVLLVGTTFAGPIHTVAMKDDSARIKAEFVKGADVNSINNGLGGTALHIAASKATAAIWNTGVFG